MAIALKYNTASQEVPLGYFVDSTDGNTEKTSLTIANTHIKLWKNGATTLANKNSGGATHISNGIYYAVLDATDTNTLGPLIIFCHPTGALPIRVECVVLPAMVYDSLIANSDKLEVDIQQIAGSAVSTSSAQLGVNLVNIAGSAVNTSSAQLGVNVVNWKDSTAAAMTGDAYAVVNDGTYGNSAIKTELDAVSGYVDELESRLTATRAGYLDNLTNLDTTVSSRLASASYTAPDNSSITAIKAKTDQLNFTGTDVKATLDGETVTVATNNDKTGYSLAADQAVNVTKINGTTVSTGIAQIGVNLVNIAGSAVATGTAQLGVNIVGINGSTVSTGSAQLGVNAVQIGGSTPSATIQSAVISDATKINATNLNTLSSHDPGSTLAASSSIPTASGIVNELMNTDYTGSSTSGTFKRWMQVLRTLLGHKSVDSGTTVTYYESDDSTTAGTMSWTEASGTRGKYTGW